MKTKKILFGSTLLAAAALNFCATPPALADDDSSVNVDYEYTITAQSKKTPSGGDLTNYNGFEGIGVTVGGTVTDFTLTGSDGDEHDPQPDTNTAISGSNVYITGTGEKESSLTITSINIAKSTSTNNWYGGLEAFIVENAKVILDGGVTESGDTTTIDTGRLDMTLCVGTMSDATLDITNGASITFNGVWNTLGSNLHTGTINISGEGSYLCTQQISIGMVYVSLSSGPSVKDGYYFAQYLESDSDRDAVVAAVTSGEYTGSYGIINVTDGGTYAVGVGNTNGSNNRLQLSNGEINIDGEGSSMILGGNSSIFMMGENGLYVTDEGDETGETMHIATGVNYTEKIIVTNGGSVVNEEGTSLRQAIFGDSFYAANTTVKVSVEGEGSTFDIAVGTSSSTYDYALFGSVYGYYQDFKGALSNGGDTYLGDGGSADVSISASDGGSFKVSAQEGIYAALDNAADYFDKQGDYKGAPPEGETAGHSYGISVEFAATTGGTIELEATNGSNVVLAAGSAATTDAEGNKAEYKNTVIVKADGTLTDEDGNVTAASSVSISGANIYANAHDAENVYVKITATNGGSITLTATGTEEGTPGVILLNQNTSVIVESGSSLTLSGAVTLAAGASMDLNGTIDLSERIQNSGEITVGEDVVFVLRENDENFKDEDEHFNFTYTFITNTEADETTGTTGGTIEGWDSLSTGNFAVFDAEGEEVTEGIGVITKADGQATVVFVTESESGGTATVDYDYYIEYVPGRGLSGEFYCIGITVDGTVDSFVLQDRTSITGEPTAITSKDVLFIGSGATDADGNLVDSVTITEAKISNTSSSTNAFAVEGCTVIIDGQASENEGKSQIVIDELGMSLNIGTMYGAGDAELVITNGSNITTSAIYNTVGSNLNTGTITIEESSTLATQQITLGGGVDSLFACNPDKAGQYQTYYFYDSGTYAGIRAKIVSGESLEGISYGIVNVESGSTFSVGVGNKDHSTNKFQLSNGELNVDGAGSQMVIGQNSCFLLMGEWGFANSSAGTGEYPLFTGICYTEKINVTGGGKITNEVNEDGETTGLYSLYLGEDFLAANTNVKISVSGSDDEGNASTFDLTSSSNAHIGTKSGYDEAYKSYGDNYIIKDGGTMDVTISASEGGEFKITAKGIFVCADNYETYLVSGGDEKDVGHSYGIDVKLSATDGGSLELNSVSGGTVLLAAGSPKTEEGDDGNNAYKNSLTIKADGTLTDEDGNVTAASSVTISGGDIYTNFGDKGEGSDNVYVTITATNGGTIALSAATVDDTGKGVISFGLNTKVTVEENSSLTTEGTSVSFESGSSLIVNAGASWTSSGSVTVAEGASMSLNGTIDLSEAIQNSGSVTVDTDVVFVLIDSLLVEGSSATYALIINGDSGTITNWDSDTLGLTNFVYADGEALSDVVLDLSTAGYVKLLTSQGGVVIDYEYETPWQRGDHGLSGYIAAGKDLYYFEAIKFDVSGVNATNFTLQDANETAITNKNVYIVGDGKDSSTLTITNINVSNTSAGYYAFVVENATVVINGTDVKVDELGMSLCIGTMDSAELQITSGAQVSTSGVWSTIGSNMATGTLTISGEGSSLTNAQINIGMAVTSLSGGANEENGDGYYFGRFVQTESHYQGVLAALNSENYQPTDGSYGIVNVKEGGTWTISGSSTSNSRIQFSNGEINIDGEGSSLIFGTNSSLVMGNMTSSLTDADGNSVTLTVSETLNVTNGGTVKNANDTTLHEAVIGGLYYGATSEAAIYVSGSDEEGNASSVDLSVDGSGYGYIGYVGDSSGGSEKVTISATDGGSFKLSTVNSLYIAYVSSSYASSSYSMDISFSAKSGGSVTLDTNGSFFANRNTKDVTTSFTAEDGGSLTISSGSVVYFGYQTKGEGNNIEVTATGEDSTVNVSSGTNMYTSYEANYGNTTFTAEDGGSLTLAATGYICLGYGSDIVGSTAVLADGGTVNLTGTQIVTNNNSVTNFTVELTATNGGTMTLTTTSGISFGCNTTVTVDKDSSLTLSGAVTLAAGASMDLNGTIDLSNQIQNSGEITVGEDVVFVLRENDENFKDEDEHFNFTYDFITNTEADETTGTTGGTIEGWDSLSTGNFAVFDAEGEEVTEGIGVITKADGQATVVFVTEGETGTAITDYDFYIKAQSTKTNTGGTLSGYTQFTGIGTLINGTVDGFVLQDRTSITGDPSAITGKNVYFAGVSEDGSDQLTITSININNGDEGKPFSTSKSFIVENCTVIIDGGDETGEGTALTAALGMSLCIGTMADAELVITNGAKITTGAYYSTVGSNGATGTITVSGEGSTLSTQQISIGMSVFSLSSYSGTSDGDYFAQYLESDDERNAVIQAILSGSASGEGYEGSYGIVNVTDGGTWNFAPSDASTSQSKLQLANGEINIKGGVLVLGGGSGFVMMGESSIVDPEDGYRKVAEGVMLSQTINVTDGGKIYSDGENGVFEVAFGDSWVGAKETTTVTVDGEGSSFDVYVGTQYNGGYIGVYFGGYRGYWNAGLGAQYTDGGTEDTTISATNGGVFKVKTEGNIYAAADNYLNYVDDPQYSNIGKDSTIGHSYGLNVDFTAETGGTIDLEAAGDVILGGGSPYEADLDGNEVNDYTNSVTITADGTSEDGETASSVTISGANIYTNYGIDGTGSSDDVYVTIKAKNGGKITLTAGDNSGVEPDSVGPLVANDETGNIVFNKNTTITVDKDSSLTLSGAVTLAEGASMELAGTETISDALASQGAITVSDGTLSATSISVTKADGSESTTDGVLTIAGGETTVETLTIGNESLGGSFSMTGGTLNVTWTASEEVPTGGFSIASAASASFSGGTVNVSTAIANDGAVTVSDSIVFVLNDSLKVEGTSATYAIIINGEGGTIEGWGDLGTSNFVYGDLSALDKNVVLDLTTDGYVKLLYTNEGVTIDYDYETPWQRGAHGVISTVNNPEYYYFRAIHIDVDGTAGDFELSDANGEAITGKNVYFTGVNGDDKLTITSAKIDNGDYGDTPDTQDSFIVEGCTVVFDGTGINIAELGMNLSIGTKADATLQITGGAKVTTSAYLNTVGANLATGTITISGEGSLLDNQQITLGVATNSLSGISGTYAEDGEYWIQFIETEDEYQAVIAAFTDAERDPTKSSYGIVNITDSGTWKVGVGSTNSSQSKLQLANGEINIDGGSLILGNNSSLLMQGENMIAISDGDNYKIATGISYSEKLSVTGGGSVSVADSGSLRSLIIGSVWYASNDEVELSVSGSESSVNLAVSAVSGEGVMTGVMIGYNMGYWEGTTFTDGYGNTYTIDAVFADGGSERVSIEVSEGASFKVSTNGGIYVAADNFANYYEDLTNTYGDDAAAGHSNGLEVSISATSGGSISLSTTRAEDPASNMDGVVYLGVGSPTEGNTSSLTVKSDGTDSSVSISAYTIYMNYESSNLTSSYVVTDGGSLDLSVSRQLILGYNSTGSGNTISIQTGIAADEENGIEAVAGGTITINVGSDNKGDFYTNYGTGDLALSFGAYEGGTITITADNEIALGVGEDPSLVEGSVDTKDGSFSVTADGEGSKVAITNTSDKQDTSGTSGSAYLFVNYHTDDTFVSTITASNGGCVSIEAYLVELGYGTSSLTSGGTINLTSTGSGSELNIAARGEVIINYKTSKASVTNILAKDGGHIYIGATENAAGNKTANVYIGYRVNEDSRGGTVNVTATGTDTDGNGSSIEISAGGVFHTNWQTTEDFTSSYTAKEGTSISISAASEFGVGYLASGGSATFTADGGTVSLSNNNVINVNWASKTDFTSSFTASNGGTLTISASEVYFGRDMTTGSGRVSNAGQGNVKISATGDGSVVEIYATSGDIWVNGSGYLTSTTITASDKGEIDFYTEKSGNLVYFGGATSSSGNGSSTTVTISDGSKLYTSDASFRYGASLSLDATSTWDGELTYVLSGGSMTLNGTVYVTSAIENSGTITVSGSSLFVLSSALQDKTDTSGNTYIVIVTDQDSVKTWHDLTAANFIFADGTNLGRSVVDVSTDGVVTITEEQESATLIWNGKESLHAWDTDKNDKDWKNGPQDDSFYTGDNVIFNEVAEDKDVTIDENLIAGTITVELSDEAEEGAEADYTFDFGHNASLSGDSLTVGEGTSLEVTGNGSLNVRSRTNDDGEVTGSGETDIAGDMTVSGNADVSLEDVTVESSGSLSVEDGSLTLTGNENAGTTGDLTVHGSLDVSGGTVEANGLTLSKDDESDDGASATFSGGETTIDGDVTVDSDSTLTVSGDGSLTADSVEVDGTLDFEGGTLNTGDLTIASDENTTLKGGDLNIGSLTVSEGDSVTFGDGLTVGAYDEEGLTLDEDLNINLDGSVGFDTSNGDIEIEGTISDSEAGEGSLTKTGSGTLTLDGENEYTGGTTIDEGTIDADNTSALGTGEVDIHKGATLKVHSHNDSGDTDSFENSTTGEGTLEIAEGDIHFTEDVGVQNVIVDKGATLDGNTTLTHSDASLDLAGTLEINVDEGEHITISDSGKVVLEYDAELDLESPSLSAGDSFVIVDGGTVTGDIDHFLGTDETLSSMQSDYAIIYDTSNGLSVSIENTGTRSIPNMRLHDGLYSDFIAAVITEEDMTLVAGIQGTGDVSSNPIARELLNGNVSRAVEMLNTLAPNDYAAMIAMPTTAFHNDVSSIDKRLAAVRAMPFSEDENARWGYFAQADGTFAENDDANDTPTFDFQLYGILAGADYRMSNTLTVGVALGYDHEHAKLHNSGGRIDGDDVRVTVYAGAQLTDTVYANVGAQVGYGYYEARRHTVMGRASGETEGYNAGVFADVGMDLPLSEKYGISARPYVGLAYLRSFVRSFDDNLFDIGSFNNDSLRARVGLGVFWDLDGVSLGIDTSFSHDFCGEEIDDMSATYRATGSKFSMMAECLPEDVFSVGPVVSVGISEGLSAFAGYSFQAGSNEYIGHNVYIGVRASF